MFWIYAVIYGGFVAINLIKPTAMETTVFLGLNLAVVYGMGLILLAFLAALAYNAACNKKEVDLARDAQAGEK